MGPLNEAMKALGKKEQTDIVYDIDWTTLGEYLESLERRGVAPNVASFVGATTVRIHELGFADRPPTPEELVRMQELVRAAMREGALGVKSEGCLVVSGTEGYIYVPAPWWKTEYFEARFENQSDNKKFYYKFAGDGLRYEIAEFGNMIRRGQRQTFKLRPSESTWIAGVVESARADAARFA